MLCLFCLLTVGRRDARVAQSLQDAIDLINLRGYRRDTRKKIKAHVRTTCGPEFNQHQRVLRPRNTDPSHRRHQHISIGFANDGSAKLCVTCSLNRIVLGYSCVVLHDVRSATAQLSDTASLSFYIHVGPYFVPQVTYVIRKRITP